MLRRLAEVYVELRATNGTRLLYEDDVHSTAISSTAARDLGVGLPALGGTLVTIVAPRGLRPPPGTGALLSRVAQEAIRNVRSHGHATEVEIELEALGNHLRLTISDDGRGFTPALTGARASVAGRAAAGVSPIDVGPGSSASAHFGLRLMHDLVAHAGGRLVVTSAPGEGTLMSALVPARHVNTNATVAHHTR